MLRLAFVTGTEPGKWFQRFQDNTAHGGLSTVDADDSMAELLAGHVDLALTRLPDPRVDDSFHVVRLYEEAPGLAVPKDSVYAEVGEALALADVSDEHLNYRLTDAGEVDIAAVREALQVVAANVGIAKGRTARSSRQEKPKRTAREKAKAKQSRRIVNNPLQKQKKCPKQRKRR